MKVHTHPNLGVSCNANVCRNSHLPTQPASLSVRALTGSSPHADGDRNALTACQTGKRRDFSRLTVGQTDKHRDFSRLIGCQTDEFRDFFGFFVSQSIFGAVFVSYLTNQIFYL